MDVAYSQLSDWTCLQWALGTAQLVACAADESVLCVRDSDVAFSKLIWDSLLLLLRVLAPISLCELGFGACCTLLPIMLVSSSGNQSVVTPWQHDRHYDWHQRNFVL